jgi:hypothetical protein
MILGDWFCRIFHRKHVIWGAYSYNKHGIGTKPKYYVVKCRKCNK